MGGDKVVPRFSSSNDSVWVGCDDLLQRMAEIEDVRFHIFGHIHEGYGVTQNKKIKDVMFINASTVNVNYQCVNKAIMFYVKGRGKQYSDLKSLNDNDNEEEVKKNEDDNDDINGKEQSIVNKMNQNDQIGDDKDDNDNNQEKNVEEVSNPEPSDNADETE